MFKHIHSNTAAINHYFLGILLKDTGRPAGAEAEFREAVRLDGDHVGAAIGELGRLLAPAGRAGEAVDLPRTS
jgi:hypothetical protein